MESKTHWFFSWNAYDATTWEHLPEYSYGEVFVCDAGQTSYEIFENLMAEKQRLRENLWIQCIAFNKI
ncbi:hypothetical protein EI048_18510 [Escherichia coli]|uniref:hypothetical protein n=1 Tax=Escherichia coli TaxID=562 RepID=UPI000DA4D2C2|nr:hypothetical protein [Escherichia coli]HCH8949302.1 hypothetical protein [Shigella flexneri]EAB6803399.1 hypothetical protein [Escherichia coli]EEX0335976.1 hypothetical protein [Escherichia coli]EEX0382711.1 hypothetical protein [Escherichia coli]EFF0540559.1 hypothetical protein [Escherichia coli]